MSISTHVLDTARGLPGAAIAVALYAVHGEERSLLTRAVTNHEGRTDAPLASEAQTGIYELEFRVGAYFAGLGLTSFYDQVVIRFRIDDGAARYHVPLLIAPWGYSTYRGS